MKVRIPPSLLYSEVRRTNKVDLMVDMQQTAESKSMEHCSREELLDTLFESEAQKKAIVDGFTGILILFGKDFKAKWVSKATLKKYPDTLGKTCHEIFCSENDSCSSCALKRCFENGTIEMSTQPTGLFEEDEEELIFDITASPVKGKDDKVSGVVAIASNVTEQFRLEKQLRHTQKMEAIGTLAGGVAHDFNNVLTPIMGYAEIVRLKMAKDGFDDQTVFKYLDEILRAAKRAKSLVEQVLTFSRSTEKREALQYLHPIVKEVMKLIRVTLPSTIVINEEIDENCGRGFVDPVQMHQVLINLCTNAAHAMERNHGVLTITLEKANQDTGGSEWMVLSVADTGSGIEEKILDRIFEPYFTTKEKTSGTGMGLAMVHGIVNNQGGRIEVESEIGAGTVFKVFLPVVKNETVLEQIVSFGDVQLGAGHILLVDDEEQVVNVTAKVIESLGYTVVGETSAVEAVKNFCSSPDQFDLLLTGLTMPELTGLELSEKIKKIRPDLPIVLFTGYSDQVSKDAAMAAGISEYCMKPVSMKGLSTVLSKVIGNKKT